MISEEEHRKIFSSLSKYKDVDEYVEKLVELIRTIHYERTFFVKNSDNEKARDEFFDFLKKEFVEIYNTYKKYSNDNSEIGNIIEFVGEGRTTLAFRIGDNVLKIGKSRIKNHYYEYQCLIPVYFSYYQEISSNEGYSIELTPLVDTKDLTDEDTYEAYKKMRSLGYIWNDAAPNNIGKIIKTIECHNIVYEKGDIVIVDLEDFAYVGEVTPEEVIDELAFFSYNHKAYVYEMRYIEEQEKKNKAL